MTTTDPSAAGEPSDAAEARAEALASGALPFATAERAMARAYYLGQRFDPKVVRDAGLAFAPYFVPAGSRGVAVLFRYGAVVLFDVREDEIGGVLDELRGPV